MNPSQHQRIRQLRRITNILDNAIPIPGTKQTIGLDPIIGLIPGGGDTLMAVFSAYIIFEAALMGLPRDKLTRMVINVLLDTFLGTVPMVGDLFDAVSKANSKNMALIDAHLKQPQVSTKTDQLFIILLVIGLILFIILIGFITSTIFGFILGFLNSIMNN